MRTHQNKRKHKVITIGHETVRVARISTEVLQKHNSEIDYIPFSCPVVSAEMRGKSQEGRRKVEGEINNVCHG